MVAPSDPGRPVESGMVKTNLILTSAARRPSGAPMSDDLVRGGHEALNKPVSTRRWPSAWALRALQEGRFLGAAGIGIRLW